MDDLKSLIREIPDFPKPGILFYDITTLLRVPKGLRAVVDGMKAQFSGVEVDVIVGIEARGFIFGPALAYAVGAGFVPARKPGKLPGKSIGVSYALEYGSDSLQIHDGAIEKGQRVLIIDDLLATGGTAAAAASLVEQAGGIVSGLGFAVELTFLNGRSKLGGYPVQALVQYDK